MSIHEFLNQHIHSASASVTGAAASIALPFTDILSKIIVGVSVGVLTWIITKSISYILKKLKDKKCSKD